MRAGRARRLVSAAAAGATLAAGAAAADLTCPDGLGAMVKIVALDDRFDLALADGRIAGLPGLDFGAGARARDARTKLSEFIVGQNLPATELAGKADRWGRLGLWLGPTPEMAQRGHASLAEAILASGIARYRPDGAAKPCRTRLLAAEAKARAERRGIWADLPVLAAADRAAVVGAPPGMSVVEGQIAGLGDATGRLYVNFGTVRAVDFSFTISRRNLSILETLGVEAKSLVGRRVRVRGLIDRRFGPQMEITSADAIEFLDDQKAP